MYVCSGTTARVASLTVKKITGCNRASRFAQKCPCVVATPANMMSLSAYLIDLAVNVVFGVIVRNNILGPLGSSIRRVPFACTLMKSNSLKHNQCKKGVNSSSETSHRSDCNHLSLNQDSSKRMCDCQRTGRPCT